MKLKYASGIIPQNRLSIREVADIVEEEGLFIPCADRTRSGHGRRVGDRDVCPSGNVEEIPIEPHRLDLLVSVSDPGDQLLEDPGLTGYRRRASAGDPALPPGRNA